MHVLSIWRSTIRWALRDTISRLANQLTLVDKEATPNPYFKRTFFYLFFRDWNDFSNERRERQEASMLPTDISFLPLAFLGKYPFRPSRLGK